MDLRLKYRLCNKKKIPRIKQEKKPLNIHLGNDFFLSDTETTSNKSRNQSTKQLKNDLFFENGRLKSHCSLLSAS